MTAIDWNGWRAAYPSLNYEQHQDFYSRVYEQHPQQRHFNKRLARRAIRDTQPVTVVELGGWDGELAGLMLTEFPSIRQWANIEICEEAARAGAGRDPRYVAPILERFYWEYVWRADLFVASHTIEHLTLDDLDKTLAATVARALYLDAPLTDTGEQWADYDGTHILDVGWYGVDDLCDLHGYRLTWRQAHNSGKACLYER